MPKRFNYFLYVLVFTAAALSLVHATAGSIGFVLDLLHKNAAVQLPFGTKSGTRVVNSVLDLSKKAGLRVGDTVLQFDGQAYRGYAQVIRWTHVARPGEILPVTVRRQGDAASATVETVRVPGAGYGPKPTWAYVVETVFFLIPFLSLFTGLYVLLAKPFSLHAWLVFLVLAYTPTVFFPGQFMPPALLGVGAVWSAIAQTLMPIALLLFGLTFPERAAYDRRYPWLKYVLIVPQLLFFPTDLLFSLGGLYDLRLAGSLVRLNAVANVVEQIFGVLSICLFFALLGYRMGTTTGDARRRLRVLYFGASVGMTPFFVLLVISFVRGTQFGEGMPRWIFLLSAALLLVLPVSLAYVVVVQRAMDLRILIRQGTKYFFARHTLTVVRVLLGFGIAYEFKHFFSSTAHQRTVDLVRIFGIIGLFFAFRFVLSKRLQKRIDERFFREAYSSEQVLSELSDEARNFTEMEPLLETISQRIGATLHVERIAVFLRAGDTFRLQLAMGVPLPLNGSHALSLASSSATISTLSRAKAPAAVYRDDPSSWLVDATDAERLALEDLSTELLVPLPGRNRLIGVMALGPKRSEEPYSRTDRQLLQTVASQTGLALENAELLETLTSEIAARERVSREIEIAREVQQRLFPQSYPKIAGVDMAGFCRPAQAVGGDYYDLFSLDREAVGAANESGNRLAIAVGDISGKGISAALLMASLRASLRSLSRLQESSGSPDIASLMGHVNDLVYEASASNRYATFFFAELDACARTLTYVNAGHNPPVILRGGESIALAATGMVVGLLPGAEYTQAQVALQPGDVFLAFTDGISESMTAEEEEWGEDRMVAAAQHLLADTACTYSAEQMIRCLVDEADRFTAGAPQHDDMTLLICRMDA